MTSPIAFEYLPGESPARTVRFEHRGWTEANAAARSKFGDWPVLLDRFAAVATAES